MTSPRPYYITTPIYYVNDRPHIGHCYTTLLADAAARFQRLARGEASPAGGAGGAKDVFFLTGTDEHADKVVTSAAEHSVSPQEWADRNAAEFKKAFEFINSSHDDFIRTTEPRHKEKVVEYITALMKSGDIYKGEYTGWYDAGQEEYLTETAAREAQFKSPISGRPLVQRTEPCYFFRLSKYQGALLDLIGGSESFVAPAARRAEVLGRLKPPAVLHDVPVSRPVTDDPATKWGIRIPGDDGNRIYVWIDALFNYLSVVDTPQRRRFWPASVNLIGKDILWFHAVIWPALLMALRGADSARYGWVGLPGCIFGHGWWISEGQKMSKSLGNFIDLEKLRAYAGRYSLDALRWYLVTQGPLAGNDADFSHAKFIEVYNADLANGIGNCASRVSNMIAKYFEGKVPGDAGQGGEFAVRASGDSPLDLALAAREKAGTGVVAGARDRSFRFAEEIDAAVRDARAAFDRFDLTEAFHRGIRVIRYVDDFISHTAPFTLAKQLETDERVRPALGAMLYACAEAVRIAALLVLPAMPQKMADLLAKWGSTPPAGVPLEDLAKFGGPYGLKPGTAIVKGEALFMRADAAEAAPV